MTQHTETAERAASPRRHQHQTNTEMQPSQDFLQYLKAYAREKPDVAALWCFGIGFVVGWKLKPW